MPKHGGETHRFDRNQEFKPAFENDDETRASIANDNVEGKHERAVEDVQNLKPAQEEKVEQSVESGALGDLIGEIERAKKGSVVFLRGLTAKHGESEARDLSETRFGAKNYVAGIERWRQKNKRDDIVVVSAEELQHEGAGQRGEHAESVIKKIAGREENQGKTLVVDFEPELESILFKPWKKLGAAVREVMDRSGAAGERWLAEWFRRQREQKKEEGQTSEEPTAREILEAYFETVEDLRAFKRQRLGDRDFSLILDGDNPLEMLFLTYCATGRIDPEALEHTSARAKRLHNRVVSVHFEGETTVTTSLGSDARSLRLAA